MGVLYRGPLQVTVICWSMDRICDVWNQYVAYPDPAHLGCGPATTIGSTLYYRRTTVDNPISGLPWMVDGFLHKITVKATKSPPQDAAILIGGVSLSYYLKQKTSKKQLPLPPSPKGLPVLGNALQIPLENLAQEYANWGRELDSDIVSATALGKSIVVVNSIEKAFDLLDKRSAIYSSRFQSTVAAELLGFDYPFALLPYNDRWKERRRMFVQNFRPTDLSIVLPQAQEFINRFLVDLKRNPEELLEVARG
ncbi:hypothetical protein NMY22_g18811 [Coprinellus aureogranulatus]|nr:hypothetical protein NMY22_g18811 [Coprinellus aureogranulatus]